MQSFQKAFLKDVREFLVKICRDFMSKSSVLPYILNEKVQYNFVLKLYIFYIKSLYFWRCKQIFICKLFKKHVKEFLRKIYNYLTKNSHAIPCKNQRKSLIMFYKKLHTSYHKSLHFLSNFQQKEQCASCARPRVILHARRKWHVNKLDENQKFRIQIKFFSLQ